MCVCKKGRTGNRGAGQGTQLQAITCAEIKKKNEENNTMISMRKSISSTEICQLTVKGITL